MMNFENSQWYRPQLALFTVLSLTGTLVGAETSSTALSTVAPTFNKDIAPMLQAKCQDCHRKDSMAPMSLITYEETRPWAKAIKDRVARRQMPPWHLDKGVGIQDFKNDMSLSDDQIATIVKWVDGTVLDTVWQTA